MTLFHNGLVPGPRHGEACGGMEVLARGAIIRAVSERLTASHAAERIDLGGRVLMPRLIDAHVCV